MCSSTQISKHSLLNGCGRSVNLTQADIFKPGSSCKVLATPAFTGMGSSNRHQYMDQQSDPADTDSSE